MEFKNTFPFISRTIKTKGELKDPKVQDKTVVPPAGRKSRPDVPDLPITMDFKNTKFIDWGEIQKFIPVIRRLSYVNPDVGLGVNDMVQLTNTGHNIQFDKSIDDELVDKMRKHINEASKKWGDGTAGVRGLVNKLLAQIWVSGALSSEAIVNNDLTSIENVALVNPETIVFGWNKATQRYEPYQKNTNNILTGMTTVGDKVKLNQNTYKYLGLNGDTEIPYGIPPFLTALNSLDTQSDMVKNIRFITKQAGLWGFLQVLLAKPTIKDALNTDAAKAQLNTLLDETKTNLLSGMADGIVVGFEEDHKFEFNSTTKNISGLDSIFNINETQVANGLKTPPSFLGASSGKGTETAITIIFTKMLAQLKNVQEIVAWYLQFLYSLELKLAGFNFDYLKVEFNPSTITDELKLWQGKEVKQRVLHNLRVDGIISQETYADQMGYQTAYSDEPEVPFERQSGNSPADAEQDEKREKDKDTSDRKGREKKKPQPKRKDQKPT